MSIEFPCPNCGQTLRTPDGSEGRKARCPSCSSICVVPSSDPFLAPESTAPPTPKATDPWQTPTPQPSDNPYAAPQSIDLPTPTEMGDLRHTKVTFSELFDRTKDMFVAHWMQALILGAIAFGINIAMGIVSNIANVPAQIAQNQAAIIIVSVIMQIIQFVVQSYVIIIGIRFSQNVINRVPDPLKNIFTSLAPLVPVLLAQLVVLLITIPIFAITGGIIAGTVFAARGQNAIVIAAIIATVIPAVIALLYLTARVFLTTYFVVLRNNGPIEAIQNSFAFTQGNAWVIIGMNLILVAAMFVLAIPTCCIGPMLFGTSAMHFFGIITYLSCTGQWTDSMIAPR